MSAGLEQGRILTEPRIGADSRPLRVVKDLDTIIWSLTGGLTAATRDYIDPDGSRVVDDFPNARAFKKGDLDRNRSLFVYRTGFRPEQEELFKMLLQMVLQVNIAQFKNPDSHGFKMTESTDIKAVSKLLHAVSIEGLHHMELMYLKDGLAISLRNPKVADDLPAPVPWPVREALKLQTLPDMRAHYVKYREIAQQRGIGAHVLTMAADQHSVDAIFSFYRRDNKNMPFINSLPKDRPIPSPNRPADREILNVIVESMSVVGVGGTHRRVNGDAYASARSALASSRWVLPGELNLPCYDFITVDDAFVPVVVLQKAPAEDLGFDYNPKEHGGMFITGKIAEAYWQIPMRRSGSKIEEATSASVIFK